MKKPNFVGQGRHGNRSGAMAAVLGLAALLCAQRAVAQGWVCAEGGGNANKGDWSEEVFGWMVEKSGRGPAAIIGAVPIDLDERVALFEKLGSSKVTSLVVEEKDADSPEIEATIRSCKLVFIRGGDQSRYVNWWKGKATGRAIRAVFDGGGVVGGTSAGCAVLGELVYDAKHGSLSPGDILSDARHPDLTLTRDFFNFVPGVIFDTHFTERGRLPRLAVMLACEEVDTGRRYLGLGVDPRTAVCVAPDGTAEIKGEGTVTMLTLGPADSANPNRVVAGQTPVVRNMVYTQMPAGYKFVAKTGEILARPSWAKVEPQKPVDGAQSIEAAGMLHITHAWEPKTAGERVREGERNLTQPLFNCIIWLPGDETPETIKTMVQVVLTRQPGKIMALSPTQQPAIEGAMLDISVP